MSFNSKKNSFSSIKKIDKSSTPQSQGDTFFDSMHNSKFSEESKNKTKKRNNFYLALNCVMSPIQESILLETDEFSEFNPNQTKDENISRYLHHPIIKEIKKVGNKLIRIKPKQNYDTIVKHPYISRYNNMNNIFNEMILSLNEIKKNDKRSGKSILNYNPNINFILNNNKYNTILRRNFNNEINYNYYTNDIDSVREIKKVKQKNKSSISNNNYNNNKNINSNYTKIKKIKTDRSQQINSTTITKDKFNKNKQGTEDVKDIKKQIEYEYKLEDLEEPKDIDLKNYIDEENKNIFLNDYNNDISSLNSNKKIINIINKEENEDLFINKQKNTDSKLSNKDEILIYDSFINNNINTSENNNINISKLRDKRTTTIKKLRKKYERSEFRKYTFYTNPKLKKFSYENPEYKNLESIIYQSRKMTLELNKKIFGSIELDKNNRYYIDYTNKKTNQYEDSKLQSELKDTKINKNLLENFNDCGSLENSDFISSNNKLKENNNINNQEKNENQIYKGHNIKKNNSLEGEFLDFISNKSETMIKKNSNSKNDKEINENNIFDIKNVSNTIEMIKKEMQSNDNILSEQNNSKSDKISIRKFTSSMNQSYYQENNKNNTFIINNKKNSIYDYISPDRNPEALIRRNFSLMSPFENYSNSNSVFDEIKIGYHSCKNRIKNSNYNKEFSLISESEMSNENYNISLNKSLMKRNKLYIFKNKEKLQNYSINQTPETVYYLKFYQNLIDNSQKIRKINYKNFLKNQKKIKWEDRLHTLCWMMQICEEFAFKRDTFHYACSYFDNYLAFSKEIINNKKILDLIGITCISISGKIEEVQIPKLTEYANSIDKIFEIKDIIEMEQKICLTLGWKLINTNINTWLNWYICQWDLYIDSVDDIKETLLKFINEEDIIYYKKSIDSSYYNYRKISQLVDIIILDYYSYNFDSRILMAVCLLVIICINYNLDYNFHKKNLKQKTEFSKYIFNVYIQFINQSFDFNFFDKKIQRALEYVYQFKKFNFNYDLPLYYQINQDMLECGNYEDFISYQTVNENLENYMKDIYNKRNNKNSSEKTTSYTDKNKIFSKNT